MESRGVDWWGYMEGDAVVVGLLVGLTVLFALGYLGTRLSEKFSSQRSRTS